MKHLSEEDKKNYKPRKRISFVDNVKQNYIVLGVCWTLAGAAWLINSLAAKIISTIAIIACLVIIGAELITDAESSDEMADAHMKSAYAAGFHLLTIALLIVNIFDGFFSRFPLRGIVDLLLGLSFLYVGLKFLQFEKDGE